MVQLHFPRRSETAKLFRWQEGKRLQHSLNTLPTETLCPCVLTIRLDMKKIIEYFILSHPTICVFHFGLNLANLRKLGPDFIEEVV